MFGWLLKQFIWFTKSVQFGEIVWALSNCCLKPSYPLRFCYNTETTIEILFFKQSYFHQNTNLFSSLWLTLNMFHLFHERESLENSFLNFPVTGIDLALFL